MPREIARRLISGTWRTVDADETGGGGPQPDAVVRVVKVDDAWPARPAVNYVEWLGPAPAPPDIGEFDTWVQTGI